MFTYINENFLHAPSTDLSRETVKTLISVMLAQAQEVFLEKQIADGKKVGLLAKLASQAAFLYTQAVEGAQENVNKAVFEKVWLLVCQVSLSVIGDEKQVDDNADQSEPYGFSRTILPSTSGRRRKLSRCSNLQTTGRRDERQRREPGSECFSLVLPGEF